MKTKLKIVDTFSRNQYEHAYRLCDNYAGRRRQIELIVECGGLLQAAHRMPLAGSALRVARLPARMMGWGRLHDFVESGYRAWSPVRDHEYFLRTIETRETRLLNRIYEIAQ